MSDSPPLTPPQQNEDSETQQNPNSVSDSENPPSETQIDDQIQPEITLDDDDDDPVPDFEPESEGMNNIAHSTMVVSETKASNNNRRRVAKRKKGCKNQAFSKKKTQQLLLQGFNPIPFVPGKSLDFSKYEEFLKLLGLWDFAQLQFDTTFRVDLIGELIVNYKKARGSYVNGLKIGVSRADLARALKLPVSKKVDCDVDEFPEAFLCFLEEFVSNLMLLHEEVWCTPKDIVASMKTIRDGHPHKFDWAGLIWYMVEKELSQKQGLKDCYYAPHLQQLIKMQKKELFLEQPDAGVGVGVGVEVENPKVGEVENSKEAVELDDDDEDGDEVKMEEEVEELGGSVEHRLEEENVELRLGQECDAKVENVVDAADQVEKNGDVCCADEMKKVEDVIKMKEEGNDGWNLESVDEANKGENVEYSEHVDDVNNNAEIMRAEESKDVEMMDFGGDYKEEDEEEEGQGQWFLDGKIGGHHFFQRCSSMAEMKVTQDRGLESVGEDHEVEDGLVEGFKILPKNQLDGITSANLMQAFETGQLPYSSTELGGQSSLDLMSSRADDNMLLGGPSMSNQAGKREIDDGHDISHHVLNDNHKRMRVDTSWDDKPPEVSFCLDQILQWAEKAKLRQMSDAEEAFQQTNVTQHIFSQQMAQKESDIVQLRYELDDLQRSKKMELDRLNRELYLMNSVVDGYRKALKQTQKTFAEYRKRCQVSDEPVYKDAGLGGVVKSVTELERERLKQEEENKMMRKFIEDTFREHLNDCEARWESEVLEKVHSYHSRLMDAVKEMELLKDLSMKRKTLVDVQTVVPREDPPSE